MEQNAVSKLNIKLSSSKLTKVEINICWKSKEAKIATINGQAGPWHINMLILLGSVKSP